MSLRSSTKTGTDNCSLIYVSHIFKTKGDVATMYQALSVPNVVLTCLGVFGNRGQTPTSESEIHRPPLTASQVVTYNFVARAL